MFLILVFLVFFFNLSCIHRHDIWKNYDKLTLIWNEHYKLVSEVCHYTIRGNILYVSADNQKKIYVRFIWIQHDNNNFNIRLLNVFGCTVFSVFMEDGVVYIFNNITNPEFDIQNVIQMYFADFTDFLNQLQQWILGLPGDNTKYELDMFARLSHINYSYKDKNVSIIYRQYHTHDTPVVPKVLEINYERYRINLTIHHWNM